MKTVEIFDSRVNISNEEYVIYEQAKNNQVFFQKLTERQQKVATDMYLKNILLFDSNGRVFTNDPQDLVDISW